MPRLVIVKSVSTFCRQVSTAQNLEESQTSAFPQEQTGRCQATMETWEPNYKAGIPCYQNISDYPR